MFGGYTFKTHTSQLHRAIHDKRCWWLGDSRGAVRRIQYLACGYSRSDVPSIGHVTWQLFWQLLSWCPTPTPTPTLVNTFEDDIPVYHNEYTVYSDLTSRMMTSSNGNIFRVVGPFVRGIHRSPVDSSPKGHWRRALMFSMMCVWTNNWVGNRNAGHLRCHLAHYDVNVMGVVAHGILSNNHRGDMF